MPVNFFPTSLSLIGIDADIKQLMAKIDKIFHKTGFPLYPFFLIIILAPIIAFVLWFQTDDSWTSHTFYVFFGMPVLFFGYLGLFLHTMGNRKSQIDDAVKVFNNLKANPIGINVEWNDDYIKMYQRQYARRSNVVIVQLLSPKLVVKMNIPRRQQYCSRFGIPFEYPSNQNTSYPDYPVPPPYSLASNPGSFPYPDQGFVQHPQAPYQPQYQRQPPTAPSNHPAYQTKY